MHFVCKASSRVDMSSTARWKHLRNANLYLQLRAVLFYGGWVITRNILCFSRQCLGWLRLGLKLLLYCFTDVIYTCVLCLYIPNDGFVLVISCPRVCLSIVNWGRAKVGPMLWLQDRDICRQILLVQSKDLVYHMGYTFLKGPGMMRAVEMCWKFVLGV